MFKRENFLYIVGILLLVTALFDFVGFYYLREMGLAIRFIPLTEEQMCEKQRFSHVQILNREGPLYKAIQSEGLNRLKEEEQIIQTLEFVMNSVSKVEPAPCLSVDDLYILVTTKGHGCLCSGMAHLFHNSLILQGIPSRKVSLKRDLLDKYDTHVTVEVFYEGRWIIFDPYFNVSFAGKDGKLLGAFDIQKALFNGSIKEIEPIFYGEVKYPQRIQNYYINWAILYNNVFIYKSAGNPFFKMPPLRWFLGTKAKFVRFPEISVSNFNYLNCIYFFFVFILPVVGIILGGLVFLILFIRSYKLEVVKKD